MSFLGHEFGPSETYNHPPPHTQMSYDSTTAFVIKSQNFRCLFWFSCDSLSCGDMTDLSVVVKIGEYKNLHKLIFIMTFIMHNTKIIS